jgi:uncharacterized protein (TIGR03067 family)
MAKLAGTWQLVAAENAGHRPPEDWVRGHRFVLTAEGTYLSTSGGRPIGRGSYVLDPAQTPRAVDFIADAGLLAGRTLRCIYRLDGDELGISFCEPDTVRPQGFTAGRDSRQVLMVYKRQRPR